MVTKKTTTKRTAKKASPAKQEPISTSLTGSLENFANIDIDPRFVPVNPRDYKAPKPKLKGKDLEEYEKRSESSQKGVAERARRHQEFVFAVNELTAEKGYTQRQIVRVLNLLPIGTVVPSSMQSKLIEKTRENPTRAATKSDILLMQVLNLLHDKGVDLNKLQFDEAGRMEVVRKLPQ